jgi:hypothetical protein
MKHRAPTRNTKFMPHTPTTDATFNGPSRLDVGRTCTPPPSPKPMLRPAIVFGKLLSEEHTKLGNIFDLLTFQKRQQPEGIYFMQNNQNNHKMFSGTDCHKDKCIGMELASERNRVRVCMAILR